MTYTLSDVTVGYRKFELVSSDGLSIPDGNVITLSANNSTCPLGTVTVMLVLVTLTGSPVSTLYHMPVLEKLGEAVMEASALKLPSTTRFKSPCVRAILRPLSQSPLPIWSEKLPCVKASGNIRRRVIILAEVS
ncbi:hypothetical protein SDC9_206490 [bioreactor metagenome]|uniref:Uncharacterized protein n=1 Tax=bioreactor metagenome TaxID=1076179 RepID=A0A645J5P8_9ZZZZ